jgi:hypothetical protein
MAVIEPVAAEKLIACRPECGKFSRAKKKKIGSINRRLQRPLY